jgi:P22 tail accessory factor
MTFPSIRSSTTSQQATDATAWTLALPATVSAGDLLLAFASVDDGTSAGVTWDNTTHGTWTQLFSFDRSTAVKGVCYAKVAAGTEGGGSLSLTISTTQRGVMRSYSVQDWFGALAGVEVATSSQGGANANPPSLTASWGAVDNLWLAYAANDGSTSTATVYPTDFGLNQATQGAGGGPGAADAIAMRNSATATQDPGAFTNSSSGTVTATIVIRPAGAGASLSIDADPASFTRGSNTNVDVSFASTTGLGVGAFAATLGGETLTVSSALDTGGNTYTLTLTCPSGIQLQHSATGYALAITENAVTANSAGNIPLDEPAGWNYTNLSNATSAIIASPAWTSGRNYAVAYGNGNSVTQGDIITNAGNSYYVNQTGTLGATAPVHTGGTTSSTSGVSLSHLDNLSAPNVAEVFYSGYIFGRTTSKTNSTTAPADGVDGWTQTRLAGSALDGYSGDKPVSGDQIIFESVTAESAIGVQVSEIGVWTLNIPPATNQTIDWYVIQADGDIGTTGTATYVASVDSTPDQFTFTDQNNVSLSTQIESNAVTISGITVDAAISISGGEYAVNLGAGWGGYTASSATVPNGAQVRVRVTSSSNYATSSSCTLTVGGVSDLFSVTTIAADTTPDQFSFVGQTNVPINTTVQSNSISVSGINAPSQISIAASTTATYSINGSQPTSSPGTVANGDIVVVHLLSSASYSTATSATLTIGGILGTFTATTIADPGVIAPPSSAEILFEDTAHTVDEYADIGDTVATLSASGGLGGFVYSITSGNDDVYFSLSSDGALTLLKSLDVLTKSKFVLVVEVTDGTTTESAYITLHVIEQMICFKVIEVVRDALQEIIVQASEQPLRPTESATAIRYLNRLVTSWPFELGYIPVVATSDTLCIPRYAQRCIVLNLAMELAPQFGQMVSQDLRINASNAYSDLLSRKSKITTARIPAGVPMGSGNRATGYTAATFFSGEEI